MRITFSSRTWDDYQFWLHEDRGTLGRINELIKDARRNPFGGIGKPEPLRGELSGWWSRRITLEHRLVYRVTGNGEGQTLEIAACRFHYSK